ncbi:hypothetical protein [Photobacterium damselae]|uniref:hypothetical protein n=1 Tax=Photobacterium damselae TaxID=38293 RepID=UPI001F4096A5|nr:hypothetical protein [Photobacterium damselae]UKA04632.1 hypothetical protein IHC89_23725 [Photobacterium damselae subsp. damselae]
MKKNVLKVAIGLVSVLVASPVLANTHQVEQKDLSTQIAAIVGTSSKVYEDKIDVSYLAKLVITPKDDWIGNVVYKNDGVCIEVTKELKFKTINKPFKHLYRSANLPSSVDVGVMEESARVVDCSQYISHSKVIE